jgi:hypothetical protein
MAAGVGIYGGSAGGQNAMGALLFHPEFYKVAVSYAGCHDNRMDKIWWNEQWMGWPIGPQYSVSSNVDNAGRLQGQLLLVVGYFLGQAFAQNGVAGLVIAAAVWAFMLLIAFFQGDNILLSVAGAKKITADDHPQRGI